MKDLLLCAARVARGQLLHQAQHLQRCGLGECKLAGGIYRANRQ